MWDWGAAFVHCACERWEGVHRPREEGYVGGLDCMSCAALCVFAGESR
jgi:hypothetical protein